MFPRVKKAHPYEYLQVVENQGRDGKLHQRVLWTIGRVDRLKEKGTIDKLLRSLTKYSERALLLLVGVSDPNAVIDRLKKRFHLTQVCIVSDRGMMSKKTIEELEKPRPDISYISGARNTQTEGIQPGGTVTGRSLSGSAS